MLNKSILDAAKHGLTDNLIAQALGVDMVPMSPFFEIEYGTLAEGEYYTFESILHTSKYKDFSQETLTAMELEYKLQIEFCHGILYKNNKNYYTEENIKTFEALALSLPDSIEEFSQLRERYLNVELPKIRAALERYRNPSVEYLQALENLGDILRGIE